MPSADLERGNILVLTDSESHADRLGRWVAAAGERPVVLTGTASVLLESGEDENLDLLVTDLDTDDPAARALLDRLFGGELLGEVPQIHLFRDVALRHEMLSRHPERRALCLASPPDAEDFQSRLRLAVRIGRLQRLASRSSVQDTLTSLPNRRYLLRRLDEEFARSRRYRSPVSLVIVDVDGLKSINDVHGLVAGDAVIRGVAERIRRHVRREDVLGRMGEDSFGIVLTGNRYRGAAVLANKIRTEVDDLPFAHEDTEIQARVSAGISTYPDNRAIVSADDLVRATEDALAQAKSRGGHRLFIDEGVLGSHKSTVLVADPDATLLNLAEDLLALDDLAVIRADSAEAAVAALHAGRPDLVVLDVAMSDGGVPLLDRIFEIHPGARIPVIGLARDHGVDPEALARAGVDRFLTKPFSVGLLRNLAREMLSTARNS